MDGSIRNLAPTYIQYTLRVQYVGRMYTRIEDNVELAVCAFTLAFAGEGGRDRSTRGRESPSHKHVMSSVSYNYYQEN